MRIAAIDASTITAGVALWEDGEICYEALSVNGMTHSQTLMPMVAEAMNRIEWKPQTVDAYAAVNGPGSFTGIRIGVATAKGLAEAARALTVGVNTLETLAFGLFSRDWILPVLDARRGQVYTGLYKWIGNDLIEEIPPMACAWEEMAEYLPKGKTIILCGDGAKTFLDAFSEKHSGKVLLPPVNQRLQRASSCAILAAKKLAAGEGMDAAQLTPFYLRASSALTTAQRAAAGIGKTGKR
ncbi:MAG: tRNA (adenosine(37)-N6)-threonylcarbamoyltransferase complex dimerization subunit type 1 TsaB [Christensenellales bacterium]|jgi:tRNA threonylcarbamoyladenosine biosynthesis protein TsaB